MIAPRAAAEAIGGGGPRRLTKPCASRSACRRAASISPTTTPSRTTPNLDLLNGVDFKKGCYVGQEVVSRMKHRGTARKRVARVTLSAEAPPPGAPILDGELAVGSLGSSSGRDALAMLRLDRVEEAKAAGRALSAAGVELALAE